MKAILRVLISLLLLGQTAQATFIACAEGTFEELDLPEEFVNWKLDNDEIFGTHYSFELRRNIDEVELDNIFIIKRNNEKIDFFINLLFLEIPADRSVEFPYASVGFSLSDEIREGSELYAVFNQRHLNCTKESRKYRIRMPQNKKRNEMDGSDEPPIR